MDSFLKNYKNIIYKSVPKKHLNIVYDYVCFVELCLKLANHKKISEPVKIKKFDLLYRQIFKNCALKNNLIYRLQNAFIAENISLSLLSDMINVIKPKVSQNFFENITFYNNYQQNFASNLARFIMVLNDLTPSVYIPLVSAVLCSIILDEAATSNISSERIIGLLKDAKLLPLIVKNKVFRFKAWCFIEALEILTLKHSKKLKLKISKLDLIKIFTCASFKWLFVKVKTLKSRGI